MATEKKRSMEEFLNPPKRSNYVESEPIDIEGYLKAKKGVSEAQMEKPKTPVKQVIPKEPMAEELPPTKEVVQPIKQVGTGQFTPPAPQPAPVAMPQQNPQAGFNTWERALVGATPLLVGLLTGNSMEGAQMSGKLLMGQEQDLLKRELDFETKLKEMQLKRTTASAKGPNAKTFEYLDSQGKERLGRLVNGEYYRDEATDPLSPMKTDKATWQKSTMKNPQTGNWEIAYTNPVSGETKFAGEAYTPSKKQLTELDFQGEPTRAVVDLERGAVDSYLGKVPVKPSAAEDGKNDRFNKAHENRVVIDFAKPTSSFNKTKDQINDIVKAADILNANNPLGNEGNKVFIAKSVFGQGGVLSDQDLIMLQGSGALDDKAVRQILRWRTGQIGEQDLKDIREILDKVYPYLVEKANMEVSSIADANAEYPGIRTRISAYAKGKIKGMPEFNPKIGNKKLFGPDLKVGTEKGGYKYTGGDPSNKDSWEKVK
jgi:hypothetical protein